MFTSKPKSVDSITAKLQSIVAELGAHAEDQLQRREDQLSASAQALSAANAHQREHERATAVAGNIKALLDA